jgi:hypothetical protein
MAAVKNVVLIGASGNLGPSILNAFLANGNFNITVLSRLSSTATFPSSVRVVKTDYNPESLTSAFQGQDAVVSIAGSEQLAHQQKYVDAAIAAGVKRFIPSEFGSDLTYPNIVDVVPLFKPKAQIVEYLKSKESETFSWSSVINGPFFDWVSSCCVKSVSKDVHADAGEQGLKVGFLGFNLQDRSAKIWDDGEAPFSGTNLATIGEAVVRVLLPEHLEQTKNKYVFVASHTTTQNKILATLEKITGQKWKVEKVESAPLFADLTAKVKAGQVGPDVIYPLITVTILGNVLSNFADYSAKLWNDKLGLPKEDLETDVKNVLDGKQP